MKLSEASKELKSVFVGHLFGFFAILFVWPIVLIPVEFLWRLLIGLRS